MTEDTPAGPTTGKVRVLRTTVLGGASLALACAAHLAGGGKLPAAGVLVVTGILLGLVAVTVTRRRCRAGLLLGLLALQQAALHTLFSVASAANTTCGALVHSGATSHSGALDHAVLACSAAPMMASDAMQMPGWVMWAGHLGATGLTALLLARGEAWLFRVADRVIAVATASPGRRSTRTPRRPSVSAPSLIVRTHPYAPAAPRGPPVLVAVS